MDSQKEAITIVVPVKNRATLVLRTLGSIKAQTWRPLKVVVVDNGSTDGTPDSVKEWIKANSADDFETVLLEEATPGASAARNRGLQEVDTRLMMFFDSDDLMAPGHVETVMRRFMAGDDPDLVCFRVRYHPIDGEDKITKRPGRDMMATHICHGLLRTQGYACETALARRAGGWDETLPCWNDLEFGSRILIEARCRAFIPDVNVDVYAQVNSITGTAFSSKRGDWEKAISRMERTFGGSRHKNRDKWTRILAFKRAILAAKYWREGDKEGGDALLDEALKMEGLTALQRNFIKIAYNYTALGGRGAASLVNIFF